MTTKPAGRTDAWGEATTLSDRKRRAGQRLVIGFDGTHVSDSLRALIRELRPAGFILFARNVESPEQVLELNRELASLVPEQDPALLSVDQEGGRVQRIRHPATVWPTMRDVGRAGTLTAKVATALGLELRAMGFNLNYAPVADVDSNPKNPVIGDRAFAERPADVARHVAAFIQAQQATGVIACAKHFPGHGDTSVDSHFDLPIVEKEPPDLEQTELVPFGAAVHAGVGSVMSAHVLFPAWDEHAPATLSPHIIPPLLRGKLGFDGVVFSDDLEMKAVYGRWPVDELVLRATRASVDLLLCCKEPSLQISVFEALVRAQEDHADIHRATEISHKRVNALRERFFLNAPPAPPLGQLASMEHLVLAETIRSRA